MHPFKRNVLPAALAVLSLVLTLPLRAAAKQKYYHAVGVVDEVKNGGKILVIEHEDIPGLMEAMTMGFEVSKLKLSKDIHVGDHIRFTLERDGHRFPIVAIHKFKVGKSKVQPATTQSGTEDDMKGMNMNGMKGMGN